MVMEMSPIVAAVPKLVPIKKDREAVKDKGKEYDQCGIDDAGRIVDNGRDGSASPPKPRQKPMMTNVMRILRMVFTPAAHMPTISF